MRIIGQTIKDQTLNCLTNQEYIACNIENVIFTGEISAKFTRCNVKYCNFTEATYENLIFDKSNIIGCDINVAQIVRINSNLITKEEATQLDERVKNFTNTVK